METSLVTTQEAHCKRNEEKLSDMLEVYYGIYPDERGNEKYPDARTIADLIKEIENGETVLSTAHGFQTLIRCTKVVLVNIFYQDPETGKGYKLKETKQQFNNGREEYRNLSTSLSEKFKSKEDPIETALKGIKEELSIALDENQLSNLLRQGTEYKYSKSYPGLMSHYEKYIFEVFLNDSQYLEEGYIEFQEDKHTLFEREELEKMNENNGQDSDT